MNQALSGNRVDGKDPENKGPQSEAKEIKEKKVAHVNQYSRRKFLAALFLTGSFEGAKRVTGIRGPYASRFIREVLFKAGYRNNGGRFPYEREA